MAKRSKPNPDAIGLVGPKTNHDTIKKIGYVLIVIAIFAVVAAVAGWMWPKQSYPTGSHENVQHHRELAKQADAVVRDRHAIATDAAQKHSITHKHLANSVQAIADGDKALGDLDLYIQSEVTKAIDLVGEVEHATGPDLENKWTELQKVRGKINDGVKTYATQAKQQGKLLKISESLQQRLNTLKDDAEKAQNAYQHAREEAQKVKVQAAYDKIAAAAAAKVAEAKVAKDAAAAAATKRPKAANTYIEPASITEATTGVCQGFNSNAVHGPPPKTGARPVTDSTAQYGPYFINDSTAATEGDCMARCADSHNKDPTGGCNYFSYAPDSSDCMMWQKCPTNYLELTKKDYSAWTSHKLSNYLGEGWV